LQCRGCYFDRNIRVARTIADLEGAADIEPARIAEAINCRTVEWSQRQRLLWRSGGGAIRLSANVLDWRSERMPEIKNKAVGLFVVLVALLTAIAVTLAAEERRESFDQDPGWDGHNNRLATPQTVRQDFGWSSGTAHCGRAAGEIGGWIAPAAEPAYYARKLPTRTLNDVLAASGTLFVEKGAGHALIGFFHADTLNEWRTPNTVALRINQRGDVFHCHLEYCTSRWRAGAGIIGVYDKDRDRMTAKELKAGRIYTWSLRYDPNGNGGAGLLTATLDGDRAVCELSPEHRADGAEFNRFGILNVMKSYDDGGTLWLDDVTIAGEREDFGTDPQWEARGNRRTYDTRNVRPRFDFGYSHTRHAGGRRIGELGGLVFRGDCRYGDRLAAYGDRLSTLTLQGPLRASGKVCLRRAVTDSTSLIGFHHSVHSLWINPSQQQAIPMDFLGVAIEGPSREGFYFYPLYRSHGDGAGAGVNADPPRIYPDSAIHEWTLEYDPAGAGGNGRITVTLDRRAVSIALAPGHKAAGGRFDRFGIVTPWIDGNGQHVYLDDLSYTCRQD